MPFWLQTRSVPRMGRLLSLWVSCFFVCVFAGALWAQDAPDPAVSHLRQLSSQVSQLRALTVKNGQAQQGQGIDVKKQLSNIERNQTQLEANVSTIEQQHQQQIADVKALNVKLMVVIAVLGVVVILLLLLLRCRHRHGHTPCQPAQPSPLPQLMLPKADATSTEQETAAPATEAAPPEAPQPTDLGPAPSVELGRIVAGDVQATRNALSEARKGFMKPVDLDH